MSDSQLQQILDRINNKSLPPVHLWNPEFSGEMDMRIAADGNWYYRGSIIARKRMVKLFSTILRYEQGNHYLVTPVEKYLIDVEDAPFISTQVDRIETEPQALLFRTNVDDEVIADAEHRITVKTDEQNGQPRPYLHVRNGLKALINRNVFYQLVDWAQQQEIDGVNRLVLHSRDQMFILGRL